MFHKYCCLEVFWVVSYSRAIKNTIFLHIFSPMKHSKKGLTLVELIIVVVILGVLATIGTVSYTSYIGGSRDANRLTQMSDIQDGLSLMSVSRALPKPENSIDILAGSNVIWFQWYAWAGVLSVIGYQNGGQDPQDDTFFTYYTDVSRKSFQLLWFLEEQPQISYLPVEQSYANGIDYSFRFPAVVGNRLGVLVEDGTNTPVQEIPSLASGFNIAGTSDTYKSYYTTSEFLRGDGDILSQIHPKWSCKRLLDLSRHNGSGVYRINPTWAQEIQVYCDMETDGGWWTLVEYQKFEPRWGRPIDWSKFLTTARNSTSVLFTHQDNDVNTSSSLSYRWAVKAQLINPREITLDFSDRGSCQQIEYENIVGNFLSWDKYMFPKAVWLITGGDHHGLSWFSNCFSGWLTGIVNSPSSNNSRYFWNLSTGAPNGRLEGYYGIWFR